MPIANESFRDEAAPSVAVLDSPTRLVGNRTLVLVRSHEAASEASRRLQRQLNVVVAILGIIAAAPVMLLVALAIKLTSPGPVFYSQLRVGLDRRRGNPRSNWRRQVDYGGKLFRIYKFRTMRVQQGPSQQVWAAKDDPRVTPIGRFLRQYRLDELPQLFNVLKGDMNIVGPRPEQPNIFVQLRAQIDGYADRQRVLPGITGWAQVNQAYDCSVEDVRNKLKFDLEYTERQSLQEDLRIMMRTLPVMLFRQGGW
jgi:lipopolysaccharide/colanic/teichoic acid biosynthesis glycosyltransferase